MPRARVERPSLAGWGLQAPDHWAKPESKTLVGQFFINEIKYLQRLSQDLVVGQFFINEIK